jgi:hypothetical protein
MPVVTPTRCWIPCPKRHIPTGARRRKGVRRLPGSVPLRRQSGRRKGPCWHRNATVPRHPAAAANIIVDGHIRRILHRAKKALQELTSDNPNIQAGITIVLKALEAPIGQFAQNLSIELGGDPFKRGSEVPPLAPYLVVAQPCLMPRTKTGVHCVCDTASG